MVLSPRHGDAPSAIFNTSRRARWVAGTPSSASCAGGRSRSRHTKRRPDQVASIAQTLLSTRPCARPNSRTTFSFSSVATPELRLGQATQSPPAGCSAAASGAKCARNDSRSRTNTTTTSSSSAPARQQLDARRQLAERLREVGRRADQEDAAAVADAELARQRRPGISGRAHPSEAYDGGGCVAPRARSGRVCACRVHASGRSCSGSSSRPSCSCRCRLSAATPRSQTAAPGDRLGEPRSAGRPCSPTARRGRSFPGSWPATATPRSRPTGAGSRSRARATGTARSTSRTRRPATCGASRPAAARRPQARLVARRAPHRLAGRRARPGGRRVRDARGRRQEAPPRRGAERRHRPGVVARRDAHRVRLESQRGLRSLGGAERRRRAGVAARRPRRRAGAGVEPGRHADRLQRDGTTAPRASGSCASARPSRCASPAPAGDDLRPDWSPDGRRLAFTRADRGRSRIWVVRGARRHRPAHRGHRRRQRSGLGDRARRRSRPAPRELLPDLDQQAPADLVVIARDGGFFLGFTSAVDNLGAGPLRISGWRPPGKAGDARRPDDRAAARRNARRPRRGHAALPVASAPPPLALPGVRELRAAPRRRPRDRRPRPQERLLPDRPLRPHVRARPACRAAALPRQLRRRPARRSSASSRDRRPATSTGIPRSSTARTWTSRRSRPGSTCSSTAPTRPAWCARRATRTTRRPCASG